MAKKVAQAKSAKKKDGVNKTKFIRDLVQANNAITWKEVLDKWHADGHTEGLNQVLYYHVRRAMGLVKGGAGKKRIRKSTKGKKLAKSDSTPVVASKPSSMGVLLEVERHLDSIISALGSSHTDVVEALRNARRHVSSRIVKGS